MKTLLLWLALAGIAAAQTVPITIDVPIYDDTAIIARIEAIEAKLAAIKECQCGVPDDDTEPDDDDDHDDDDDGHDDDDHDDDTHNVDHGVPDFAAFPGAKVIAEGETVNLSGTHDVVVIDGDVTIDSPLDVVTLHVRPSGKLTMLPGCDVRILDRPIDLDRDPGQWGNGIVCEHGEWTIKGTPKTVIMLSADGIPAGTKTLKLFQAPAGWKVGDELFLPDSEHWGQDKGVAYGQRYGHDPAPIPRWYADRVPAGTDWLAGFRQGSVRWEKNPAFRQDETIRIAAIDGDTVTLESPSQHSHPAAIDPSGFVRMTPAVLNITRDVRIRSENPGGVRGHTLALGRSLVDHQFAEFDDLGRTEMAFPIEVTYADVFDVGITDSNIKARYNWHMHHVSGRGPVFDGHTFRSVGLVTWDSPKWAHVVHGTSHGLIKDCISGDSFDAGFTTEDGNELFNIYENCHAVGMCRRGFWAAGQHNSWIRCAAHGTSTGWWIGRAGYEKEMSYFDPNGKRIPMPDYPTLSWVAFRDCYVMGCGEAMGVSNRVGDWTDGNKIRPGTQRNIIENFGSYHTQRTIGNYGETSIEIRGLVHVATADELESRHSPSKWCLTSNGATTVDVILKDAYIANCDLAIRLRSRGNAQLNHFERVTFAGNKVAVLRMPWTREGFERQGIEHRLIDCVFDGNGVNVECDFAYGNKSIFHLFAPDRMFVTEGEKTWQVFYEPQSPDWVIGSQNNRDAEYVIHDADGMTAKEALDQLGVAVLGDLAPCDSRREGFENCFVCPIGSE